MIQEYINVWIPTFGWMYWVSIVVCIAIWVGIIIWSIRTTKTFTLFDFGISVLWIFFSVTPPFNVVFTVAFCIVGGAELIMKWLDRSKVVRWQMNK